MTFFFGVALFALGIAVTIALHEWGHMMAARVCGMRVRRYFIGFGPTLWSTKRRHPGAGGHITEYGVKAVPLGGFCDIAGMTAQDPVRPEEEPYAMYKQSALRRIFVLSGGVLMNILVGLIIIYLVAVAWGLPNIRQDLTPRVESTTCVPAAQNADGTLTPCEGSGPAAQAGLQQGDVIVAVDGVKTNSYLDVVEQIRPARDAVAITVQRGDQEQTIDIQPDIVQRRTTSGEIQDQAAIGVAFARPDTSITEYNPATAVGVTVLFAKDLFVAVWEGLLSLPSKVPGVVASIFGGDRAQDSPMSVVGASRIGGEMAENNLWSSFLMLLANLNFFLALFNLVPLPPLDGGHIAVVIYEKIRDAIRRLFGKAPAGPADYNKLMPITMFFTVILLFFGVIVIAADVVNPIRLF